MDGGKDWENIKLTAKTNNPHSFQMDTNHQLSENV